MKENDQRVLISFIPNQSILLFEILSKRETKNLASFFVLVFEVRFLKNDIEIGEFGNNQFGANKLDCLVTSTSQHQIFDEKFDQKPESVRIKMADLAGR